MIFISKELTEEAKLKKTTTYYNKAIVKAKNEIGNKYNKLTVLDVDYDKTYDSYFNNQYHKVYVKARCDCGTELTTQLSLIKSGHSKSCGCIRFNNPNTVEDLTGQKFGRLTVIGRDIQRDKKEFKDEKHHSVHWLCKCDCGNPTIKSVVGYQLKSGKTQSCGCYASEQIAKRNKKYSTKINKYIENSDDTITLFDDEGNQCLIDKEDYDIIKNWYWTKKEKRGDYSKGYWSTNVKVDDKYEKSTLPIHQVIAEIKFGEYNSTEMFPDHLSRNNDDNRKCNIILKSNFENSHNRGLSKRNSSGKTGVSYNKEKSAWSAYITVNYQRIHLGDFSDFNDAVKKRKKAEKEYGFTCDDVVADYDESCNKDRSDKD